MADLCSSTKRDGVTFALIAEAGALEHQAVLLVESLRLFAGQHSAAPVVVMIPRPSRRPSATTIKTLSQLNADIRELDVTSVAPDYGTSWRVHASAIIERDMEGGVLACLDSDIFFAGEPDLALGEATIAARPVDVKGMCTTGPGDERDEYWRRLCDVCEVPYERVPEIVTTFDRVRVKASYNGGFIVARADANVFQRTEEFFVRAARARLRPWGAGIRVRAGHGMVEGEGARHWGSAQACLSLAVWGRGGTVRELPPTCNFPAHLEGWVAEAGMRQPLVAVHYHHLFETAEGAMVRHRLNLPPHVRDWLDARLPLPT